MHKTWTVAAWLALTMIVSIGCTRHASNVAPETVSSVASGAPESSDSAAQVVPVSQVTSESNTAFGADLSFLNEHFVVSDNAAGRFEPTRLHAQGNHIVFEYDNTDPGKPKTHGSESAIASDLNPDSVRTLGRWLEVDCKQDNPCVMAPGLQPKNTLNVGAIAEAYAEEAAQHLKRMILLQQGKAAPEVLHAAGEEEIAAYLRANVRSTAQIGPFSAFNRIIMVSGDDLIVDQDLLETDSGRRGHLTVKIRLSEANLAVSTGQDVGIGCDLGPDQTDLADCVSDTVGDQSNNIEIANVRNAPEVVKMLNRLILLHKREESASASQ